MIIAIDGPAAAGKGTLAVRLMKKTGFLYLDTGALYRAVAVLVMQNGGDVNKEEDAVEVANKLTPEVIIKMQSSSDIRTPQAGEGASVVSVHPKVRSALLDFQRNFGKDEKGAILDGRDIGTVIFPNAEIKFFVTATPEVRANRRYLEFKEKGIDCEYEEILADVKKRDERDMNRANAPLKPADDAIVIDTSEMNEDEVFEKAMSYVNEVK